MKFATVVSRLFEPMGVLTVLVLVAAVRSGLPGSALVQFFLVLLFGMTLPIGVFRFWMVKTHQVDDWDMHKRHERIKPLGTLILLTLFFVLVVSQISNPFLTTLFIILFLWLVGFFLITLKIKASGHVGVITLAVLFFLYWYGVYACPLIIAPFLVAWARLKRKDHTLCEVLVGASWSILVSLVYLMLV
jgi:hypothetical protein